MDITLAITVVIISTLLIFKLYAVAAWFKPRLSHNHYLNMHAKYQLAFIFLAGLVLFLIYLQNPHNFHLFFSTGNILAAANPVPWLGITGSRSWLFAGLYLSVIITLGTVSFVYFQFRQLRASLVTLLPYAGWIILFSLTNSFAEEIIFRLGLISPLFGLIDPAQLALLSAIIFGLAHFSGMPHGLVGILMATFLGWFLAKSVIETGGLFWAWTIHFIQDVVIYCGFVLNSVISHRVNMGVPK